MKRPPIWVNMLIVTTYVTLDHKRQMAGLKDKGADGIEIPFFEGSAQHYRAVGELLRELGMPTSAVSVSDVEHDPSSMDEQCRRAGVNQIKERIEWAAALREGAGQEEIIFGGPLVFPWGEEPEVAGQKVRGKDLVEHARQRLVQGVQSFKELGEYAKGRKVKLAIEGLTHWELFGLNTATQVLEFVELVDHENVGVHIDMSHETLDGDGPDAFRRVVARAMGIDRLFHFHISAPDRGDVTRSWLPWDEMLGTLKAHGWNKPLVIETFNAVEPFASGCRLTRAAYEDPVEEMGKAIAYAHQRWQNVPQSIVDAVRVAS